MTGFRTLLWKELLRFWKVSFQTVAAPVVTALLYLLIFTMPNRNGVSLAFDYYMRRRSGDLVDQDPPTDKIP